AAGQQLHAARQQSGGRYRFVRCGAVRPLPRRERAPHGRLRSALPAPAGGAVAGASAAPADAQETDTASGIAGMKALPLLVAIVGVAAMATLVGYFGAGAVMRSLIAVGAGGFAAICAIHLALIAVMGLAWRALLPGSDPGSLM